MKATHFMELMSIKARLLTNTFHLSAHFQLHPHLCFWAAQLSCSRSLSLIRSCKPCLHSTRCTRTHSLLRTSARSSHTSKQLSSSTNEYASVSSKLASSGNCHYRIVDFYTNKGSKQESFARSAWIRSEQIWRIGNDWGLFILNFQSEHWTRSIYWR